MTHQMHLKKSGSGMASNTACGRNILRSPMCCGWERFKLLPTDQQCEKCAASKQAVLNARRDADEWIPESPDAWKLADDKLIAAHRAAQHLLRQNR